jgi:hypothetical protein
VRGFFAGSLGLIVLWVVVQPGSTNKLVAGNNALMTLFRRALSGDVPAIGAVKKGGTTAPASTTPAPAGTILV